MLTALDVADGSLPDRDTLAAGIAGIQRRLPLPEKSGIDHIVVEPVSAAADADNLIDRRASPRVV